MSELYIFGEHQYALKNWALSGIKNATLVHFDTHHDCNSSRFFDWKDGTAEHLQNIIKDVLFPSDFIAPAVYYDLIDELYWVLPFWAKKSKYSKFYRGEELIAKKEVFSELIKRGVVLKNNPQYKLQNDIEELNNFYLYGTSDDPIEMYSARLEDSIYFGFHPPQNASGKVKKILMHKVFSDELPLSMKNAVVDIDCDYFSLTGFDTFEVPIENPGAHSVSKDISLISKRLTNYDIKVITIATSPDYSLTGASAQICQKIIQQFSKDGLIIKDHINKGDFDFDVFSIILAQNLTVKLTKDVKDDPRHIDPSKERAKKYLHSSANYDYKMLDLPLYKIDLSSDIFSTKTIRLRRADYGLYIKEAKRLGLTELAFELVRFERCFKDPASSIEQIDLSAKKVAGLAQRIISSPAALYKEVRRIEEIKSDYGKIKEGLNSMDDKIKTYGLFSEQVEKLRKDLPQTKEEQMAMLKDLLDQRISDDN